MQPHTTHYNRRLVSLIASLITQGPPITCSLRPHVLTRGRSFIGRLILEFSNYVVRARALTKVFFSIKGCYLQVPPRPETGTGLGVRALKKRSGLTL